MAPSEASPQDHEVRRFLVPEGEPLALLAPGAPLTGIKIVYEQFNRATRSFDKHFYTAARSWVVDRVAFGGGFVMVEIYPPPCAELVSDAGA